MRGWMAPTVYGGDLGRFGEPVEMAYVALFLASEESSYITGIDIVADDGMLAS